jgi:hypothetical protein
VTGRHILISLLQWFQGLKLFLLVFVHYLFNVVKNMVIQQISIWRIWWLFCGLDKFICSAIRHIQRDDNINVKRSSFKIKDGKYFTVSRINQTEYILLHSHQSTYTHIRWDGPQDGQYSAWLQAQWLKFDEEGFSTSSPYPGSKASNLIDGVNRPDREVD